MLLPLGIAALGQMGEAEAEAQKLKPTSSVNLIVQNTSFILNICRPIMA